MHWISLACNHILYFVACLQSFIPNCIVYHFHVIIFCCMFATFYPELNQLARWLHPLPLSMCKVVPSWLPNSTIFVIVHWVFGIVPIDFHSHTHITRKYSTTSARLCLGNQICLTSNARQRSKKKLKYTVTQKRIFDPIRAPFPQIFSKKKRKSRQILISWQNSIC